MSYMSLAKTHKTFRQRFDLSDPFFSDGDLARNMLAKQSALSFDDEDESRLYAFFCTFLSAWFHSLVLFDLTFVQILRLTLIFSDATYS